MERPTWAWVIFPSAAKAELFRNELAGTPLVTVILSDGREVVVPPVLAAEPVRLAGGKAGYACHWWAGNTGEPDADAVIRDMVEVMTGHSRYGAAVTFGQDPPAEWVPEEVVE